MQSKYNKQLVPFAKQLRKEMTKEERHLWYDFLRTHSVRFSRQNEVMRNFRGVCEYIDAAVRQSLSQKSEDF